MTAFYLALLNYKPSRQNQSINLFNLLIKAYNGKGFWWKYYHLLTENNFFSEAMFSRPLSFFRRKPNKWTSGCCTIGAYLTRWCFQTISMQACSLNAWAICRDAKGSQQGSTLEWVIFPKKRHFTGYVYIPFSGHAFEFQLDMELNLPVLRRNLRKVFSRQSTAYVQQQHLLL